MIEIRAATPGDIDVLAEMNRQMIEDEHNRNPMSPHMLAERMRGWLASDDWHLVVCLEEGSPVGYCAYRVRTDEYSPERPEVYVRHFFVVRACRRRGVGRTAFETLVRERFPSGARLVLDVLQTNPIGSRFWESLGFRPYCTTMQRMETR